MDSVLVTKHAAELCALIVADLYGERPSRILAILFANGRSTISQLAQHAALSPRQVRHDVCVLTLHNLLYYHTDAMSSTVSFEVNPDACGCLVRQTKISHMIRREYGDAEQSVVQFLMQRGHAQVSDLESALKTGEFSATRTGHGSHGLGQNGSSPRSDLPQPRIKSAGHLHSTLAILAEKDIIQLAGTWNFENPRDVRYRVIDEVKKAASAEKPTWKKPEIEAQIRRRLREERDQGAELKRLLYPAMNPPAKKRRLENGTTNGVHTDGEDHRRLNPDVLLIVNHQKCLVDLRNYDLARFAADAIGETTGQIYHTILRLLTAKVPRCRLDPMIDNDASGDTAQATVTSLEVLEHLDPSLNVSHGINFVDESRLNLRSAERIRKAPPVNGMEQNESDEDEIMADDNNEDGSQSEADGEQDGIIDDGEDEDDEDDEIVFSHSKRKGHARQSAPNGHGYKQKAKVTFEGQAPEKSNKLELMRQHLLLLCESRHGFLRHCGQHQRGQWTVDFGLLVANLREIEVDTVIERCFGHQGLRLVRILRDKGKLDDKTLPNLAMMKKSDVYEKLMCMQLAGFVGLQEVPKDMTHKVRNTILLRFFDEEGARGRLLDNVYKAMLRCLQTLEVQRQGEKDVLSFVERKDVKGREEETMDAPYYNRYTKHLDLQNKLLSQVMRMDDVAAVLRDF